MSKIQIKEISFDVDPDWKVGSFTFRGPAQVGSTLPAPIARHQKPLTFRKNLVVQIQEVEGSITSRQYYEKQLEQIVAHHIPYEKVSDEETIMISGVEALRVEQIATSPTGERIRQIQIYCVKNQRAYIFAVADLEGISFENSRVVLDTILNSIDIGDL